ncbi:amino acid efflux transporter [Nakamurella sp. UYEF19]|uniref:APC family permease n=1 Tax=Nakamurella sp. UYEF19 TaxID=1756392 RepID=UPI003397229A
MNELSTGRAVTLYVGALLGPSVLLLPGLAAGLAGPASILAWVGLLIVSGLLAAVFSALGRRQPGRAGAAAFAGAAFGPRAERVVGGCFLAGVVLGAPVVCLIGAAYLAQLVGGGHAATVGIAAILLLSVIGLTHGGARVSAGVQLVLVGVLVSLVVVAVGGALPHARSANWTPFAPHGWSAVGTASTALMLSFVGWEAIAPMTSRLRSPRRQLPRVITLAFLITSTLYLGLAVATVSVLGPRAGSATPVADLLRVAVGPVGAVAAAIAALALTLAATNAYLSGATEMLDALRQSTRTDAAAVPRRGPTRPHLIGIRNRFAGAQGLQFAVAVVGTVLLGLAGVGWVDTRQLVVLPTTMFLLVYLASTAAGVRLLTGPVRLAAAVSCAAVCGVLAFSGVSALVAVLVAGVAFVPWRQLIPLGRGWRSRASRVWTPGTPGASNAPCQD